MDNNRPLVTGTFRDQNSFNSTVSDLRKRGYTDDDFHVVMSEDTRDEYYADGDAEIAEGSKAMEGAGAGAATGGTLGGVIGAIAGIGGAVIVPGIGRGRWPDRRRAHGRWSRWRCGQPARSTRRGRNP